MPEKYEAAPLTFPPVVKNPCRLIRRIVIALALMTIAPTQAAEGDPALQRALMQTGIDLQMKDDVSGANVVAAELKRRYPDDAIGYVFNLNTLASVLSWDETGAQVDQQILDDAEIALRLCADGSNSTHRTPSAIFNAVRRTST
ncbi:MAG: hypothetical protein O3A63_20980 [Proteobacteria bacterium]|nr:hypothetical protein [Pseudomonadota bacterium]